MTRKNVQQDRGSRDPSSLSGKRRRQASKYPIEFEEVEVVPIDLEDPAGVSRETAIVVETAVPPAKITVMTRKRPRRSQRIKIENENAMRIKAENSMDLEAIDPIVESSGEVLMDLEVIENPEPPSGTQDVQALGNQAETSDTTLPAASISTSNPEPPSEVQGTQASSGRVKYEVLERQSVEFSQQTAEDIQNNENEIKRLQGQNRVLRKQLKRTRTFAGMNGKRTKTAAASEQLSPDISQEGDGLTTRQTGSPATAADQPSSGLSQGGYSLTTHQTGPSTPVADQPSSTPASAQQEGGNSTHQTGPSTPAAASRPPYRRGGLPVSALMNGDPPLPPKHIGDVPDASGSVPHPTESNSPTSIPQRTTTPSAGAANTAVESFNLSKNVVHKSAQSALLRFKNDHAYPKCQCIGNCGESCSNKACRIACSQNTCSVEESKCRNRLPEERKHKPPVIVTEAGSLGLGLKATEKIAEGDLFLYYFGRLVGKDERIRCRKELLKQAYHNDNGFIPFYFMQVRADLFIDATHMGNVARYANHSCSPNCIMEQWVADGEPMMVFRALKDIAVGARICFDYGVAPFRQIVGATRDSFKIKSSCHCKESCRFSEEVIEEVRR